MCERVCVGGRESERRVRPQERAEAEVLVERRLRLGEKLRLLAAREARNAERFHDSEGSLRAARLLTKIEALRLPVRGGAGIMEGVPSPWAAPPKAGSSGGSCVASPMRPSSNPNPNPNSQTRPGWQEGERTPGGGSARRQSASAATKAEYADDEEAYFEEGSGGDGAGESLLFE